MGWFLSLVFDGKNKSSEENVDCFAINQGKTEKISGFWFILRLVRGKVESVHSNTIHRVYKPHFYSSVN